ncbi:hypothetical protein Kpho02_72750 [Kitasatospora phosalacinea]|uniref:Uncharacterized protein n=1 Tax=Kitasatospora phosalacinea TaxID=2065 RepID=A0A9W6QHL6_9ACTN|nr:hypothetical protein Kpho02_72750 [Kitasatospora phosalacinea]
MDAASAMCAEPRTQEAPHAFDHPDPGRGRDRPRAGPQRPRPGPGRRTRAREYLLALLPAAARPHLHPGSVQPGRHPVDHPVHDLRLRLDRDGAPLHFLHQRAQGPGHRRLRLRRHSYEEDHFVPLELGGAPRDPGNLWPEPYSGSPSATTKDGIETKLKNAVCSGRITLAAARSAIKTNWTTALAVTGIG